MPPTQVSGGEPRPRAVGSLCSGAAEGGERTRAFHFHGAAGRAVVHPRARVHFGDGVVVAGVGPRTTSPHASSLGARAPHEAGEGQCEPPAADRHATSPPQRGSDRPPPTPGSWRAAAGSRPG